MRGPSSRIQIGWFSMKREYSKHTYEAFKIIISLEIKLLYFSLKITRMRSRRCFKRKNMFAKAFHSTIKGIHLTVEVKTSFGNSIPAMGSSMESSSQKPRVPTNSCYRHHWKEEKEKLHTKSYEAKLVRLRSARLTRRDQVVRLLDMQRLQVITTF
jgi:hypothetical protein